nr:MULTISPECIES: N-methyl-L-tryptophan oxidase [unclassified Nannocystis]
MTTFDVIVLGLGAHGAATVYQLARLGARVLGIDKHKPPHKNGSSHGDSRITRLACGEGPAYSKYARRSHEIWRELEGVTGKPLFMRNGLLVLTKSGQNAAHHGVKNFAASTAKIARKEALRYKTFRHEDIQRRFPAFQVSERDRAYYDQVSGFVRPENCIEAQIMQAQELGAKLRFHEEVISFRQVEHAVEVTSNHGRYSADQLVVTAGPWLPELLPREFAGRFRRLRQVQLWFRARDARTHKRFSPERFPVFIWQLAHGTLYGFPALGSFEEGIKVATEVDDDTTPETVDRKVPPHAVQKFFDDFVVPHLPGLSPDCVRNEVCLYTTTADSRFILDRLPERERIIIASPCSGHGFKHSAAIGEKLAKMAYESEAPDPMFLWDAPPALLPSSTPR